MKNLWKIRETLCEQLEEYAPRTKISGGDLQTVHMITDTIKNIDKIEMLADEEMGEYSHARRRRDALGRYSRDGHHYDDGESYADGMHDGRGMDHSMRRRYSRTDGKERMMDILEGMRDGVQGPERQTVDRMIDMVHKL